MPVGATLGAAGIGAVATTASANKAAKASQNATNASLALQQQQFQQTQQNLAPYMGAGQTGLNALTGRVNDPGAGVFGDKTDPGAFSFTADDYHASPGYQWQLDQGINAIQSSQAARGALNSGATLKALDKYGQGLANQDFTNARNFAYQQNQDQRNYLTGRFDTATGTAGNLATLGANAAAGVGTAGQNYANGATNALMSGANDQATVAGINARSTNALLNQGLNSYLNRPGLVNGLVTGSNALYGTANNAAAVPYNSMFFG